MIGILQTRLLGLRGPSQSWWAASRLMTRVLASPGLSGRPPSRGSLLCLETGAGCTTAPPLPLELLSPLTAPCPGARMPLCPWASLPCSKVISVTFDLPVSAVLELLGQHSRRPPPRAGDVSVTLKLHIFYVRVPHPPSTSLGRSHHNTTFFSWSNDLGASPALHRILVLFIFFKPHTGQDFLHRKG